MSHESKTRFDLHQTLTNQIIAAIERVSAEDFRLPWHRSGMSSIQPRNALTTNAYRGINIVSLWVAAEASQYPYAMWASYKQWQELGAQVRKAERSSLVVFYKEYDTEPDPKDENDDGKRRVARHSAVFNIAQVENFTLPDTPTTSLVERDAKADAFFAATKADIRHGGERACYRPSQDFIQMFVVGMNVAPSGCSCEMSGCRSAQNEIKEEIRTCRRRAKGRTELGSTHCFRLRSPRGSPATCAVPFVTTELRASEFTGMSVPSPFRGMPVRAPLSPERGSLSLAVDLDQ